MADMSAEDEAYLKKQYDRYGFLGVTEITDIEFAWRRLTRGEYKSLVNLGLSDEDSEDWICERCVVFPENFGFSTGAAGIPTTLSREILEGSFFVIDLKPGQSSPGRDLLLGFRNEMESFENQIDCIIAEAFPSLSIEEIADWTVDKTMFYLSRAEWTLHHLRNLPLVEVESEK